MSPISIFLTAIYIILAAFICFLYRLATYKVYPNGKHISHWDVFNDNSEAIAVGILFPIVAPFAFMLLYARWKNDNPRIKCPKEKKKHKASL